MLIQCGLLKLRGFYLQLLFLIIPGFIYAQSFTPITVTGFNQDVVAETGTSSLTTTTISLDGPAVSNKVMYTSTFKTLNGFGGGGIPDNGVITDAAGSYQMASFSSNNALLLQRTQTGDLTLTTPSKFNKIRVLCFSTEGASMVNAVLTFTDGSTTNAITNYSLGDWFGNTANLVVSGFGRCTRATPASGADAYPTDPRLYYIEITLSCTDKQKTLQKVSFTNVTTGGSNAPFPNAVFFAISGTAYTQTINAAIINATCTVATGSATLTVTGSGSPYSISWNTTPVQTGVTATNLPVGTYQATITDANSCTTVYPVTITGPTPLTMTAHADTTICPGSSFNANTTSNASTYSWSPATGVSNTSIANPVLSPSVTTQYTVTGTTGSCTISKSFTVTVLPAVTLTVHADTAICSGVSFNANTVSNGTVYTWSPITGVSNAAVASPVLSPLATTLYTITAATGSCSATKTFTVTVNPAATVNAGTAALIFQGQSAQLQGTASAGSYLWAPSAGLSAVNILNPVAKPIATTLYTLTVTSAQGCSASSSVLVTVTGDCVKPMEAFTPNGDGYNDKWVITNGNCVTRATAQVFNRWGGKVFESYDYKNDWDGTYKGKPLPDGTYYYVIHYELINNNTIDRKGNVTIIR